MRGIALLGELLVVSIVLACGETPISPAATSGLQSSPGPAGQSLSDPLGGLDLNGYCQSAGFAGVTLTKPQLGHNAAFNNWRCVTAHGTTHPFSFEQACKWQYGLQAVQAHPRDPDDAFTWTCYSVGAKRN